MTSNKPYAPGAGAAAVEASEPVRTSHGNLSHGQHWRGFTPIAACRAVPLQSLGSGGANASCEFKSRRPHHLHGSSVLRKGSGERLASFWVA